MPELKAVVSDFGGVLTTPLLASFLNVQDEIGVTPADFWEALTAIEAADGENPLFALERGEISEDDFLDLLAKDLATRLDHEPHLHRFRELFIGTLDANPPMIEEMRRLQALGLRMALLTNNVREWEPVWRALLPVDEIFETVVDSAFVGIRKPEAGIYHLTLERLGLEAADCVFVDDLEPNILAAQELGFTTVHFRENAQALGELRELFPPAS